MRRQTAFLLGLLTLTGFAKALLGYAPPRHRAARAVPFIFDFTSVQVSASELITGIANEGVLIESGERKVVIDGMFRRLAGYARPSDAVRSDMVNALGRFADVDLVLATHYHADHFDARVVRWHLNANPKASFVAVSQVTNELKQTGPGYEQVASRVLEVTPDFGQRKDLRVANLDLAVIRLRHGDTMNAGFLLTMRGVQMLSGSGTANPSGLRILHVGDADATVANFDSFDLQKEAIDYALVPYWYALDEEGIKVIREHIAPKQVIFFHIPEDNPDHEGLKRHMDRIGGRAGLMKKIKADFPDAAFLLDAMEGPRR